MSYPLVNLGEVAEFINGYAFKPSDWGNNGKGIIRIQNLTDENKPFNKTVIEIDKKYLITAGDILVSWSATIDVFEWKLKDSWLNQHIFKVEPNYEIVDKGYFKYAVKLAIAEMLKYTHGSTMKHVNRGDFLGTQIPLPPLPEQKRIAAILDKADSLRRKRQQAMQLADEFLRAVFLDMFGDPVTNPKGWEVKNLKEISLIQIGPFGTQLHKEDYIENGIPLINPTHIVKGKIVPNTSLTITVKKHAELKEYHLEVGDIIMGRRGEMGRCAIVNERESGWFCGTGSLFIRPYKVGVFSEYLYSYLSGNSIKSYLDAESQGATMPNLNKTIVGNIKVPVPSEEALRKFSIIQDRTIKNISKMKSFSDELLFNSLSQKAFAGEL